MNFTHYTDETVQAAVDLVNTGLDPDGQEFLRDDEALARFARDHGVDEPVAADDLAQVYALRATLADVFAAPDASAAAALLNELLARFGTVPRISGHDGTHHIHFHPQRRGVAGRLGALTAMALAVVLCEHGFERVGTCEAHNCRDAFVDTSKNRRRRYCSQSCAHRESVAAFRARRR